MRLARVVRWSNGHVAAFNDRGDEMAALSGHYPEVRETVLAAADEQTEFLHADWLEGSHVVSREEW